METSYSYFEEHVLYLPEHNNIFKEGEEDKDDASTHPNIKSRDIANSWCVLPHRPKHGRQGEEGGHGHGDPPGDGLGGQEEGEPGHNDKETWKKL